MAGYSFTPAAGPAPEPVPPVPAGDGTGKYTFTPDVLTNPGDAGLPGTVAANLNVPPVDDPSKLPYSMQQIAASLPTDPDAKIRYLAKAIFPDRSPADALASMGWKNGRIYYVTPDNKAFYAEPSFDPISSPLRTLRAAPSLLAANIGPGISTAGGIAGGMATPEILGGVPGAMAGGAAGDAIRQAAAAAVTGEQKSPVQRIMQAGGAGLEQGIGQVGGHLLSAGASHIALNAGNLNPLRVGASDVASLTPGKVAETQFWTDLAKKYGITVTPGEAGNIPSLIARQRQLMDNPESSTTFGNFLQNRSQFALPQAWQNVLDQISSNQAPAVGGQAFGQGAQATIKDAIKTRLATAKPAYDAVMSPTNVAPPATFQQILSGSPIVKTAIAGVRSDPILSASVLGAPDSSLPVLDLAKRHLDDMYDNAMANGLTNKARIIGNARDNLVDQLDTTFPGYADARAAYQAASPGVESLTQGITGIVAKGADKATGVQNIPATMFSPETSNPLAIAQARGAFIKAGQESNWDMGVRSYLDGLMRTAQKTATPAGSLWKTVGSDKYAMANLKAAMSPQAYQGIDDMMNIAEMIKRAPSEGSRTAADLGRRGDFASGTTKFVGKVIGNINPAELLRNTQDALVNASAGKGLGEMADLITTDPRAVLALRSLRSLTPGQMRFTQAMGYLGTVMTENGVLDTPHADQVPAGAAPPLMPGASPATYQPQ